MYRKGSVPLSYHSVRFGGWLSTRLRARSASLAALALALALPACGAGDAGPSTGVPEDDDSTTVIETPLRVPGNGGGAEEQACLGHPGANDEKGRVHDRFLWCKRMDMPIVVEKKLGPISIKVTEARVLGDMLAYGRDDGNRSVTVLFKAREVRREDVAFPVVKPSTVMVMDVSCSDVIPPSGPFSPTGCKVNGGPKVDTMEGWHQNREWLKWTIDSNEAISNVADKVLRHRFQYDIFIAELGPRPAVSDVPHTIRCDSATYFKGRAKACILDDVLPHLTYSVNDPKEAGVARHIQMAFEMPTSTWPMVGPKTIPGKYTGNPDDPGLHRIVYKGDAWKANQLEKNRACRRQEKYTANGLPSTLYDSSIQDCDEFPFASTAEGAGNADWGFSVLGVDRSQNRCAGNALKRFYGSDRILRFTDKFYVQIVDTLRSGDPNYCALPADEEPSDDVDDEGGQGGGGVVLPDQAPSVSAGPDVTVDEGEAALLHGSASDLESQLTVSWSYAAQAGVDPGTSCSFEGGDTTTPRFTCSDDGTFEVTISANDGINPAASDSAIVQVRNAPPVLAITAPRAWQLFRAGTAVDLQAPFTDGANDTHVCRVDWDDQSVDSYAAAGGNCNKAHTFRHAGMYTIKVTVTDDDGGADSESVMVVVYDPAGAFANADGSVVSPPGALTTHSGASGEEWFHLTGRYNRVTDTVPLGTAKTWLTGTDFLVDAGNGGLEWLVVTPDGKIAAKGTGFIQGKPERYGFVFYGYDSCAGRATGCQPGADRFRVVVWPLSAGANPGTGTVYDNRPQAGYDVDVSEPQELRSGIVTIHPPS